MAVVDPCALHIASRRHFNKLTALRRARVPYGIDIVMVGQYRTQRIAFACHDVHNTVWKVGGLEDLVTLRGDCCDGTTSTVLPIAIAGATSETKPSKG